MRPAAPAHRRAMKPPYRTLALTSPIQKGSDIVAVQAALNGKLKTSLSLDGAYGPNTAETAKRWRYWAGLAVVNGVMPVRAQRILLGLEQRSAAEKARAAARAKLGKYPPSPSPAPPSGNTVPEIAVAWMEARAGLVERPAGSNRVPELAAAAKAAGCSTWLQNMGWPWCAFATSLSNLIAGGEHGHASLIKGRTNGLYCPTILADAKAGRHGMRTVPKGEARRGDLLLFDWGRDGVMDHIGRARGPWKGDRIETVEGNTSFDDRGSQSDGGAMAKRTRYWSQIAAVVRDDRKR